MDSFTDAIFGFPDQPSYDENLCPPDSYSHTINYSKDCHSQPRNLNLYDFDHSSHSFTNCSNSNDWFQSSHQPLSFPNPEDEVGPFSMNSRIPIPGLLPLSRYHMFLETSFMCRRNERERQRVRSVNDGFSRLRNRLPRSADMKRRQSKVETLQHAIKYIKYLQGLLDETKESDVQGDN